jgi:hypothetical protein
MGSVGEVESYS